MKKKDKQITFGRVRYPKYINAVMLLGGLGTDKKSVITNRFSIEEIYYA